MLSRTEMKKKLEDQKNRGKGGNGGGGDPSWFQISRLRHTADGTSATIRLLPDADSDNEFFWRRRETIRLPFEGVVGGDNPTDKQVTVQVPCMDMFGEACPIIAATKPWWSDHRKEMARQYWKKKTYIFQGFVTECPFEEENLPENPIRKFMVSPQIFEVIEESIHDDDFEDFVVDYVGGRDLKITKATKERYANYKSKFRSPRSLNDAEMQAIEKHGLYTLKEFLGRKPDADEIAAIKAMFEASVAGEPYDFAAFGKYYKPWSRDNEDGGTVGGVSTGGSGRAKATRDDDDAPAPSAKTGTVNTMDIMAKLRDRTKKSEG